MFFTGKRPPLPGDVPAWRVPAVPKPQQDEDRPTLWMWSHTVKDGAGHEAAHFSLLSRDTHGCAQCLVVLCGLLWGLGSKVERTSGFGASGFRDFRGFGFGGGEGAGGLQ